MELLGRYKQRWSKSHPLALRHCVLNPSDSPGSDDITLMAITTVNWYQSGTVIHWQMRFNTPATSVIISQPKRRCGKQMGCEIMSQWQSKMDALETIVLRWHGYSYTQMRVASWTKMWQSCLLMPIISSYRVEICSNIWLYVGCVSEIYTFLLKQKPHTSRNFEFCWI